MDCLTIGDYTVTFDEQGALITRNRPRVSYRITAATATNVIDFVRHHRDLCCAMMNNRPEELAVYKVRDMTKDGEHTSVIQSSKRRVRQAKDPPVHSDSL